MRALDLQQVMWFITRLILTNSNGKPPMWLLTAVTTFQRAAESSPMQFSWLLTTRLFEVAGLQLLYLEHNGDKIYFWFFIYIPYFLLYRGFPLLSRKSLAWSKCFFCIIIVKRPQILFQNSMMIFLRIFLRYYTFL